MSKNTQSIITVNYQESNLYAMEIKLDQERKKWQNREKIRDAH